MNTRRKTLYEGKAKIIYEGPVPTETFFGEAYRSEKLSVILKMLESTRFSYQLDDRKLIITGNQ